jgi:hypothetical protein
VRTAVLRARTYRPSVDMSPGLGAAPSDVSAATATSGWSPVSSASSNTACAALSSVLPSSTAAALPFSASPPTSAAFCAATSTFTFLGFAPRGCAAAPVAPAIANANAIVANLKRIGSPCIAFATA